MNKDYIKDYKYKELRHYIFAFFLIVVSSIGLVTYDSISPEKYVETLITMLSMDFLQGAICILVMIINEIASNSTKSKIVYGVLPSDSIFSDINTGKFKTIDFDIFDAEKNTNNMYLSRVLNKLWNGINSYITHEKQKSVA